MSLTTSLLLAASVCAQPPVVLPAAAAGSAHPAGSIWVAPSDSLRAIYSSARQWEEFMEGVQPRRALWHSNWESWEVSDEQLARAQATGGPWRFLAISEAGCSDSVNTLPIFARLATLLPGSELRVVDSTVGRPWMERHRSTDDRASTPTLLLLDQDHNLRGCWVEQPAGMAEFWLPAIAEGRGQEELARKMTWYAEDAGRSTLDEWLQVLEAAAAGRILCPGVTDG